MKLFNVSASAREVVSITWISDEAIEIPSVEERALTFSKLSVTEVRVTVPLKSL